MRTERGVAFFKKPIGSPITDAEYQAIRVKLLGERQAKRKLFEAGHPERLAAERNVRHFRKEFPGEPEVEDTAPVGLTHEEALARLTNGGNGIGDWHASELLSRARWSDENEGSHHAGQRIRYVNPTGATEDGRYHFEPESLPNSTNQEQYDLARENGWGMPNTWRITYNSANGGKAHETITGHEHGAINRYEAQRRVKELNERSPHIKAEFEDLWDEKKPYFTHHEPDELENDTHPGFSTKALLNYADKYTPRSERYQWIGTQGYPKQLPNGSWEIEMFDPKTADTWTEGPYDSQDMRAYVQEQLNHYGLTEAEINRRRS